MSRGLAKELAQEGVRFNIVRCGAIDTETQRTQSADRIEGLLAQVPMARMGAPPKSPSQSSGSCPTKLRTSRAPSLTLPEDIEMGSTGGTKVSLVLRADVAADRDRLLRQRMREGMELASTDAQNEKSAGGGRSEWVASHDNDLVATRRPCRETRRLVAERQLPPSGRVHFHGVDLADTLRCVCEHHVPPVRGRERCHIRGGRIGGTYSSRFSASADVSHK